MTKGKRLGDLLVQSNLVNQSQVAEALLQQSASGKRLGELLVEIGALDERDLTRVLAEQFEMETANLGKNKPESDALERIPEAVARKLTVIPMRITDGILEVVISDPSDQEAVERVKEVAKANLKFLIAPRRDIQRAIDSAYRALDGVQRNIDLFKATETKRVQRGDEKGVQAAVTESAPVVQIVNAIITQALRDRASDVHIEPQDGRVRVRYRIDGALHDIVALPAEMSQAVVSRIKVMAGMNIVERQRSQDGQIAMEVDGRGIDIRVATTATIWGEKAVLRILDKSRSLYRLDDLGMAEDTHKSFSRLIRSPFGMVLCAGPTGSGKTTTLYASLNEIADSERNIMTIEDPVEYIFPSINQIQIKEQAGVTFAGGLKAILRQDPDIILVGEIRDVETARIAVQSALTGHFVLSSLHATDATSALHRFLDMGIESFLIASSVLAIVGQRLVRRVCESCKEQYAPPSEELVFWAEAAEREGLASKNKFWRGVGCNICSGTGYQDRIGIYELLRLTEAMKQMVVRGASHDEMYSLAVEQGMRPLRREALRLVHEDVTTISEVLRAIYVI